ncbi:LysM peptidoglycan-binding domain-containing protein [Verrucosispora sp. WMMD573]|uniref:LysM peptidoglycan-binding domain-containing protein n=1 Tax=Verrucosispora sp. WMMD573 TaxID=3015149 RepID=UPI00248D1AFC|nr:LysM peptidoglycan-binding domain-containing protein [Verrucosispora sp. WMMD573]WBB55974.1 LysM peptidoglycan-binding domain-containing protein [Verrucosispora sp. WMMD573]
MAASGGTAVRRAGRVLTGLGALVVLIGLLVGGPIALLAFAGNPLPDHVPTLAEIGATLTSRDDGQLFLRALAIAGWFGWATFALSVLVELGSQALDRPAPRLPGMGRQQRAAAALVGSVALILAASPAATAATTAYATSASGTTAYGAGPAAAVAFTPTPAMAAPAATGPDTTDSPTGSAAGARSDAADAPVYRVAKGDYLGRVADRYLDDFDDYHRLAALNKLRDPDRIRPGQLIKLPAEAHDQGARSHATGRLVAPKPRPVPGPGRTEPTRPTPANPGEAVERPGEAVERPGDPTERPGSATTAPAGPEGRQPEPQERETPEDHSPVVTVGAARAGEPDRVNRPLAVSAVLAVASIVGAQIGAVLGLRRRPAMSRAGTRHQPPASAPGELPVGRHRKD